MDAAAPKEKKKKSRLGNKGIFNLTLTCAKKEKNRKTIHSLMKMAS